MERIHKRLQLFLHSCNTTTLEDMETRALAYFGELHRRVERGGWITTTPSWVERPSKKNNGSRKSESGGGLGRGGFGGDGSGQKNNRYEERNTDVYPYLRVMERFWGVLATYTETASRS